MSRELYLPVNVAGVEFKNPFYVASGPTARTVEQLLAIEKAGWAGACLKLAIDPAPYINRYPRYMIFEQYDALGFTAEKRLKFTEAIQVVTEAKKRLTDLVLMVNITYAGDEDETGWIHMSQAFCEAGADIIELNLCCPNMSFNVETTSGGTEKPVKQTGASIGRYPAQVAQLVRAIKKNIEKPLVVKLCGEGGMIGYSARAAALAGADGVSGSGNRLGMPPIDLENPGKALYHLQEEISMTCFNGGWLKPVAQRDTYEMRKIAGPHVAIFATGAIRSAKDAIEMAMCGGDLAGICTETLIRGYTFIEDIIRETKAWLNAHGHERYADIRDVLVPAVKTATELTLYDGYAEVKNPTLMAPCNAACPLGIPVQSVLKAVSKGDWKRAAELAANAPCGSCEAFCEKACAMGRINQTVSIQGVLAFAAKKAGEMHILAKRLSKPVNAKVNPVSNILKWRKIDLTATRAKQIIDEATAILESKRCQRCGCGEGCAKCKELCCEFAIELDDNKEIVIDAEKCVACGMCMNLCPNKNIGMINTGVVL